MAEDNTLKRFTEAILGRVVSGCDMLDVLEKQLVEFAQNKAVKDSDGAPLLSVCRYLRQANNLDARNILDFLKAGVEGNLLLSAIRDVPVKDNGSSDAFTKLLSGMSVQERQELIEWGKAMREHKDGKVSNIVAADSATEKKIKKDKIVKK